MPQKTILITSEFARQRRTWALLDAKGAVLGRLATRAATLLRGKHKPFFTPSVDCGDFVVVTNAKQVRLTGLKESQKFYFRHSGHARGAKVIPYRTQMALDPRKVVYLAVKRMLPANHLRQHQLRRLKIYVGEKHPHSAQKVEAFRV
ncbi:MAG: 50S ribosomal protein L13 [Elusimicrobiota bacterium]